MDAAANVLSSKAELGLADHFLLAQAELPGAKDAWVGGVRAEAFRNFERSGLPHRRIRGMEIHRPARQAGARSMRRWAVRPSSRRAMSRRRWARD